MRVRNLVSKAKILRNKAARALWPSGEAASQAKKICLTMDCWAWAVSMGIGVSINVNSRVVAPKDGETVLSRAKLFFMGESKIVRRVELSD